MWYELFPADDDRNKLTWKGRFGTLPTLSGLSLYNFYSSGDEVLSMRDLVGPDGMVHLDYNTGEEKRNYSWQKQERFKGRKHFDFPEEFAATDQVGWGFKYHFERIPLSGTIDLIRDTYLSAADANAATTNQLKTVPVFVNAPAGTSQLNFSGLTKANDNRNIDMNTCRTDSKKWGRMDRNYNQRWLHSDLKNMALPYIRTLFEQIKEKGLLQ